MKKMKKVVVRKTGSVRLTSPCSAYGALAF
jgi:hypothetical protein